ncbi:MAG: hypothetical protein K8S54_00760 [Spirochaetia bacterium]|nr:hypothetical protein [Spirochaetia bacterium]
MIRLIRDLFRKKNDPDLFDYAKGQKAQSLESEDQKPRRKWLFLILPIVIPASFLGGYFVGKDNSCEEERATIGAMTEPANATSEAPPFQYFLGTYRIDVSGHKGLLYIYSLPGGYPGATLHFQNWGKHIPEPLGNVAIQGNRIYFVRSCAGRRCSEIGATGPFRQEYNGELSQDGANLVGQYSGGQSGSGWVANRIR